ncbi:lysine transporter LysE [Salinivibrio sp. MA351]|uniref:Lysine transporter LysE n=1 Tax=Salinivibrio costicola subsp. alcaliphilus TaxID=272773 RepID=A0ABX3KU42_SALCS|nr:MULTISPECIES: LysE family translocator [Salinivibrio]NUY56669.1 LysE family translocator [Salinivibrio sp. EAGSL]OOE93646.1 lysine transporter LysE [Salinivibrio sp. AR647]OOE95984.1 lysine transporter LysE [Salinivibrio sp. AR640]OOE97011.1 lysine transporter LysE [Salinivibrio sp. IB643]OOE99543.1 lysine transporter LysE [Salinivibrio sp. MA351]
MTLTIWASLALVCMLGAMSPGPSLVVMAKHSLANSRLHGIVASWAHAFGVGLYALITMLGLAVIFKQSPILFTIIAYAGAAYLGWLGIKSLLSKGGVAAKLEAGKTASLSEAARDGAMISMLNPKLALFFIALFSQFVAVGSDLFSRSVIVLTPLLIDGLWYTLVAFLLSSPTIVDKIRHRGAWIDKLSGVVLIALAIRVVFTLQ